MPALRREARMSFHSSTVSELTDPSAYLWEAPSPYRHCHCDWVCSEQWGYALRQTRRQRGRTDIPGQPVKLLKKQGISPGRSKDRRKDDWATEWKRRVGQSCKATDCCWVLFLVLDRTSNPPRMAPLKQTTAVLGLWFKKALRPERNEDIPAVY